MSELFEKYYQLPLHLHWSKVFAADEGLAFDFFFDNCFGEDENPIILTEETQLLLLEKINGKRDDFHLPNLAFRKGIICQDDRPLLLIRGWGRLTGTGGFHLPAEEAAAIQDNFGQFLLQRLSENGGKSVKVSGVASPEKIGLMGSGRINPMGGMIGHLTPAVLHEKLTEVHLVNFDKVGDELKYRFQARAEDIEKLSDATTWSGINGGDFDTGWTSGSSGGKGRPASTNFIDGKTLPRKKRKK